MVCRTEFSARLPPVLSRWRTLLPLVPAATPGRRHALGGHHLRPAGRVRPSNRRYVGRWHSDLEDFYRRMITTVGEGGKDRRRLEQSNRLGAQITASSSKPTRMNDVALRVALEARAANQNRS